MLIDTLLDTEWQPKCNAELTNRVLPEPLTDGEEWYEDGRINGNLARAYYYFSAEEIAAAADSCPDNPAECYPWDHAHIAYITDAEDVPIAGRGWFGFRA